MSVALCNVAAATQCETQLLSPRNDGSVATPEPASPQDKAAVNEGGGAGHGKDTNDNASQRQSDGGSSTQSLKVREPDNNNHVVTHEGSEAAVSATVDSNEGSVATGDGDRFWLTNTDILRDTIAGCLASATADVKSNLIKAMNNLMVSKERRATLVTGDEIPALFELVHGYTPEVRKADPGLDYYDVVRGSSCCLVYSNALYQDRQAAQSVICTRRSAKGPKPLSEAVLRDAP